MLKARGHRGIRWTLAALAASLPISAALLGGCSGSSPAPQATARSSPPKTPRDTYDYLRSCYGRRAFGAMEPYVDAERFEEVANLLVAMDELLAANAAAQQAVRAVCPSSAGVFDLAALGDNLDLFSQGAEYVETEQKGEEAVVRVQIKGQMPLSEIRFLQRDGRWTYLPGESVGGLVPKIRAIAQALNHVRAMVLIGPKTPENIRQEYRLLVAPRLRDAIPTSAQTSIEPVRHGP
jgi:hypothetical protein